MEDYSEMYAVESESLGDELGMLQSLLPHQGGSALSTMVRFEESGGDAKIERFVEANAQYFPEMGENNVIEALHQVHHLIEHMKDAGSDAHEKKKYAKEAARVLVKRMMPILKQAVANKAASKDHAGVPEILAKQGPAVELPDSSGRVMRQVRRIEQVALSSYKPNSAADAHFRAREYAKMGSAGNAPAQAEFWMKRAFELKEHEQQEEFGHGAAAATMARMQQLLRRSQSRSKSMLRLRGGVGSRGPSTESEEAPPEPWYIRKADLVKEFHQGPQRQALDRKGPGGFNETEGQWIEAVVLKLVKAAINDRAAPKEYFEIAEAARVKALGLDFGRPELAARFPEVLDFLKKESRPGLSMAERMLPYFPKSLISRNYERKKKKAPRKIFPPKKPRTSPPALPGYESPEAPDEKAGEVEDTRQVGVHLGTDIRDDLDRNQRLFNAYSRFLLPDKTSERLLSFLGEQSPRGFRLKDPLPSGTLTSNYGRGTRKGLTWADLLLFKIRGGKKGSAKHTAAPNSELASVTHQQWIKFIGKSKAAGGLTGTPDPRHTGLYKFMDAWFVAQTEDEKEAKRDAHEAVFQFYEYMPQKQAKQAYLPQGFSEYAKARVGDARKDEPSAAIIYKVLGSSRSHKYPDKWWQENDLSTAYKKITSGDQTKTSRRTDTWWDVLKSLGVDPANSGLTKDDAKQNSGAKKKLFQLLYEEMRRWTKAAGGNLGQAMAQYQISERHGGRARVLSREESAAGHIGQKSEEREVRQQQRQVAGDKRKRILTQGDVQRAAEDAQGVPLGQFIRAGSDFGANRPLGFHYKAFWENLATNESAKMGQDAETYSVAKENNYVDQILYKFYQRRRKPDYIQAHGRPKFKLQVNLKGSGADREQLAALVEAYAWNQYANAQLQNKGPEDLFVAQKGKDRSAGGLKAMMPEDVFYGELFRPIDKAEIERILPKFLGVRAFNRADKQFTRFRMTEDPTDRDLGEDEGEGHLQNSHTFYEATAKRIQEYFTEQEEAGNEVPDNWRERLANYQVESLFRWGYAKTRNLGTYIKQTPSPSPEQRTPSPSIQHGMSVISPSPRKARGRGRGGARPALSADGSRVGASPVPARVLEVARRKPSSRSRSRVPADLPPLPQHVPSDVSSLPRRERWASPDSSGPTSEASPSGWSSTQSTAAFHARMHGFQAQQQRVHEMRQAAKIRRQHRTNLVADAYDAESGYITQRHLLQTDNNVQPIMGSVHLVQMAPNAHEKHFMQDIGGDVNMGQKQLMQNAKAGPFANKGGRSLVLDNSSHVKYRNRHGVFEITVTRGVTQHELDILLSKLSMHRISTAGTTVRLLKGRKGNRAYYGRLADIDLRALISAVEDCLLSYRTCGLELAEPSAGSGALYKAPVHGKRFKARARQKTGPFQKR